jgi:hypothetical protein
MTVKKPKVKESELDKMQKQFDEFDTQVKEMTQDRMNAAPKQEVEAQTKLSQKEIENSQKLWLKPKKTLSDRQKFNENFRSAWNYAKEYVQFIAEHKEIIGETIEMWTHPFGGVGAEFWEIPTNKPVWAPRYVAEQIKKCNYHRLRMDENTITGSEGHTQYFGRMVVDTAVPRLTATPVNSGKSIFMGAGVAA